MWIRSAQMLMGKYLLKLSDTPILCMSRAQRHPPTAPLHSLMMHQTGGQGSLWAVCTLMCLHAGLWEKGAGRLCFRRGDVCACSDGGQPRERPQGEKVAISREILCQSSLVCLPRFRLCSTSLNCMTPTGVRQKAPRALRIMFTKSS